jgi:hypothetical protein
MRNTVAWLLAECSVVFTLALVLGGSQGSIGPPRATATRDCGGVDDPCCAGGTCNGSQLVCSALEGEVGVCVPCGGIPHSHEAQLCCADGSCHPGFTCSEGVCTGRCGGLDETCCGSSDQRGCNTQNLACDLEGFCAVCGISGGPCCTGDICQPGLTCFSASRTGNNTCQCGGPDTACCPGSVCVVGTVCDSGTCQSVSCGGLDQPCCGGIVGCGTNLFCSGGICTIPLG